MDKFSTRAGPRLWPWIVLAAALATGAAGIGSRLHAREALRERAEASAMPLVAVVTAHKAPPTQELVLPGSIEAYADAPIYARTNGYLKRWRVDIGAHVKAGDLLAEIDTPEIDQQLHQAEADLAQAKANEQVARSTAQRYGQLLGSGAISKEDAEAKQADYEARKAALEAAAANLARLRDTQGFKRIVAPFDGTITARRTDVGQLVSSGAGTELFHIADLHALRVYVQVPQNYAPAARPGVAAELRVAEHPGKAYPAQIVRTASALDAGTRTMRTQLEVDNSAGELLPGAYAEVRLKLAGAVETVRVPASTLIFRGEGTQVATLGNDHRVHLKLVTLGRDFSTELEVLDGVSDGDTLLLNPPDSIAENTEVRVVEKKAEAPAGTGKAAK